MTLRHVLFPRVTIIGVGLIGGSLALALKKGRIAEEIRGVDRSKENLQKAVALGMLDRAFLDPSLGVDGSDLVVLATPVGAIVEVAEEIAPRLKVGSILTDVGSVKAPVVEELERLLPSGRWAVGGHPIAGRERSGAEAASADLFVGAKCILTPTPRTDPGALERVKAFWERMGAEVVLMDPVRHDEVFAAVSHLPHVVAYSLMGAILALEDDGGPMLEFAAGAFKDFTRVAMSHPTMWRDICLYNRGPLLQMIGRFKTALTRLEGLIEASDGEGLFRAFERAKLVRENLEGGIGNR
ncbi:MAG: prephenate dehydrogenase [Candidatus Methylomirabilales bacterium]